MLAANRRLGYDMKFRYHDGKHFTKSEMRVPSWMKLCLMYYDHSCFVLYGQPDSGLSHAVNSFVQRIASIN